MFLILFIIFAVSFYLYATRNHDYWEKRRVKHDKPILLFGNHLRNLCGLRSTSQIYTELYYKYRGEKLIGYYKCSVPEIIVTDPELVRQILTVDFTSFYKRGLGRSTIREPLLQNLFHAEGDAWRLLRQRLTAAFTSRKLRNMFPLISACAARLRAAAAAGGGGARDVRELMARYTTDCIGSCGFGVDGDALVNEDSQFRRLGKRIFQRDFGNMSLFLLRETFPEVFDGVRIMKTDVIEGIVALLREVRAARGGKPSSRNDFIDLLLEMEQKGTMVGESLEQHNADGTPVAVEREIDTHLLAAQVFIFFAAGFETSSSATSTTLHYLAHSPDVQRRVQAQLDDVLARHGGQLTYDAVSELTLLDMCFKEAMRLVAPLGALNRICTKKYTFPGTDVTIDPGVRVVLPVQDLQNDEQYFDNPTEFRPERFAEEATRDMHKYLYLPFGAGPRNCIGMRLGQMQSLAGLAAVLQTATVAPPAAAPRALRLDPKHNVVQAPIGGVVLEIIARKPMEY